jgi:hypothetical protein
MAAKSRAFSSVGKTGPEITGCNGRVSGAMTFGAAAGAGGAGAGVGVAGREIVGDGDFCRPMEGVLDVEGARSFNAPEMEPGTHANPIAFSARSHRAARCRVPLSIMNHPTRIIEERQNIAKIITTEIRKTRRIQFFLVFLRVLRISVVYFFRIDLSRF